MSSMDANPDKATKTWFIATAVATVLYIAAVRIFVLTAEHDIDYSQPEHVEGAQHD